MKTTTLELPTHRNEWLQTVKLEVTPAEKERGTFFNKTHRDHRADVESMVEELVDAHALYWSERQRRPRLEDAPKHASEWMLRTAWGTMHPHEVEAEMVKRMTCLMKLSTLEMIIEHFRSRPVIDPETGMQDGWDHRFYDITAVLSQYIGQEESKLREALAYAEVLKNLPMKSRCLVLNDLRLSHPIFAREDLSELVGEERLVAEALLEMIATLLYGPVDERRSYSGIEDRGVNASLSSAIVHSVIADRELAMALFRHGHSATSIVATISRKHNLSFGIGAA